MDKNKGKYDLILLNSASKEFFLYTGLEDLSENHLYHHFEDLDLGAPVGEYTYAVVRNDRNDVEYEFHTPILETVVHIEGEDDIILKYLQPSTGLLRVGEKVEPENIYDDNNNDTIFYYDE